MSTDLRIIKSKNAIADALLELLKTERLDDISISEISKKSHVSRATFYNNFNDFKEVIVYYFEKFQPLFDKSFSRFKDNLNTSDFPSVYRLFINDIFDAIGFERDPFLTIAKNKDETAIHLIHEALKTFLAKNIKTYFEPLIIGYYPNIPLELVVDYLAGGFSSTIIYLLHHYDEFTKEELIDDILDLTFIGKN